MIRHYARLIHSPDVFFDRMVCSPDWKISFAIVSLGTMAVSLLLRPFTQKATVPRLLEIFPAHQVEEVLEATQHWYWLGTLGIPLLLLLKWSLYTALLCGIAPLGGLLVEFRYGLTVVASSSMAFLFESLYVCLILQLRGLEAVSSPADLQVPIGLNLLFLESGPRVTTLLGRLNLFEAWYVLLLSVGLSRLPGSSGRKGFLITAPVWLLGLTLQVRIQTFLQQYEELFS